MNSGGVIVTSGTKYCGRIFDIMLFAIYIPTNKTAPPEIIIEPLNREPYLRDSKYEVPAKTIAGATLIETNWSTSFPVASPGGGNSRFGFEI